MKNSSIVLLALAVLHGPGTIFAATLPPAQEQSLGRLPPGTSRAPDDYLGMSDDGLHVALHTAHVGKSAVWIDGKSGTDYDEVTKVYFSPDGKRHAYAARKGTSWVMVVDGKEMPAYDGVLGNPVFSPDSRHIAFEALKGPQYTTVLDGKAGPLFAYPSGRYVNRAKGTLTFSPDGQHLGYVAGHGTKFSVVVDDKPGPEFDAIELRGLEFGVPWLVFSADSRHYAYRAFQNDKRVVVADGKTGPEYDLPLGLFAGGRLSLGWIESRPLLRQNFGSLILSPDGKRVAYLALKGPPPLKSAVVVDGKEGPAYDLIDESSLTFSPGGQHLAYIAHRNNKVLVIMDGRESALYDEVPTLDWNYALTFSADSLHLAYLARRNGEGFVVVDNKEGPKYPDVAPSLAMSPDGKQIAYIASKPSGQYLVLAGNEGPPTKYIQGPSLAFSPDGKTFVYTIEQNSPRHQLIVMANGQPITAYDTVDGISFSPTGGHFGFWAKKGAVWVMVLDGVESAAYDEPSAIFPYYSVPPPAFHLKDNSSPMLDFLSMSEHRPDVTAEYLAVRHGVLYRVTQTLSPVP